MINSNKGEEINFHQKDLDNFRIFTLVFVIAELASVIINLINKYIGLLIAQASISIFLIGILLLALKYPKLSSGIKVALFFFLSVILNLVFIL